MLEKDLRYYSTQLPQDVQRLVSAGYFIKAEKLIASYLEREIPFANKKRLMLELDRIALLKEDVYPFTYEEALAKFTATIKDATEAEFQDLIDKGRIEWIFLEGNQMFHEFYLENLIKTTPDLLARADTAQVELMDIAPEEKKAFYDENIARMRAEGKRRARVRIKASVQVKPEAEELGNPIMVHVPIPRETDMTSNIEIHTELPENAVVARADARARTVCFQEELTHGRVFEVDYSYDIEARYAELDPSLAEPCDVAIHLRENLPHYPFSPTLRSLVSEVVGQEINPLKKARLIYDFITQNVMYSLMPPYATIPSIAEYAATNLKGDCGVQAALFIAMCRIAGVPACWESGLSVRPLDGCHCHDWAQFYVKPFGWLRVDVSFGGSAYREGDLARWNYYFGNLDIYRMQAAGALCAEFTPAKKQMRNDPTDNQVGEAEYEDRPLRRHELICTQELVSFEELEDL